MVLKRLSLVIVPVLIVVCGLQPALAEEKTLVVFRLDPVNVDVRVAEATSVALASELESRGYKLVDYESALLTLESPPTESKEESTDINGPPAALSNQQLKQAIAVELGATHYMDGSLVKLGKHMQIRVAIHPLDGEVLMARKAQVKSEDELSLAIKRIVDSLTTKKEPKVDTKEKKEAKVSVEKKAPAAKGPNLEKNFGIIFGQAFGFGDMEGFSQFAFDGRFELDNVIIEVSPGIGFGPESFENPQFIFDMAVSYYLSRTRVSPYLGAGLGIFIGNRLGGRTDTDSENEVLMGWNLFPTVGIELLRNTFMRVHIDFRYIFNYSGDRYGHAPMAMAGVNF